MLNNTKYKLLVGALAITATLQASAAETINGSFSVATNVGPLGPQITLLGGTPFATQGAWYNYVLDGFGAGDSYSVTGDHYPMADLEMPAGDIAYGVGQVSWGGFGANMGDMHRAQLVLLNLDQTVDLTINYSNAPAALLPAMNVPSDCTLAPCANGYEPSSLGGDLIPGFTIYQGAALTGDWVVTHGFNNQGDLELFSNPDWQAPAPIAPFLSGVVPVEPVPYFAHDANLSNLSALAHTYHLSAGQWTLLLGGTDANIANADGSHGKNFALTLSAASPVPVPAAAWLFGGAIASLIGVNRRKRVLPA